MFKLWEVSDKLHNVEYYIHFAILWKKNIENEGATFAQFYMID